MPFFFSALNLPLVLGGLLLFTANWGQLGARAEAGLGRGARGRVTVQLLERGLEVAVKGMDQPGARYLGASDAR